MTKQVKRRRGTAAQHTTFTGADGEITVNTTNKSLHVHDGATAGGFEAARVDMQNVPAINGTAIGSSTPSTGAFTTLSASTSLTTPLITRAGTLALSATGANVITASTNGVERMRINSIGRVGIGNNNPEARLDVTSNADFSAAVVVRSTSAASNWARLDFKNVNAPESMILYQDNVGRFVLRNQNAEPIIFQLDGSNERMRITSAGNVGIGTSSPAARLEVSGGDVIIRGATVGRGAGSISTNTAVGFIALSKNTTGNNNAAYGFQALRENTTASNNTAYSSGALENTTTGGENTAVGRNALGINTTGSENTSTGSAALLSNTTGIQNTALGRLALRANTTGNNNIGIGVNAGRTGASPQGIINITTENNRIVMGNDAHTDAYIKIAWTVTSDARDKAGFAPIPHGLDFVNALQPTEYQFKAGGRDGEADGRRRYGFLAQDILELEGDNPVIADAEDPDKLKLHESYLVPVLVNAVKELTAQVQVLQDEVKALKG